MYEKENNENGIKDGTNEEREWALSSEISGNPSFKWLIPAITALGVAGKIAIDRHTLVKPEWPPARTGDPLPRLPSPDDPPFHRIPLAETYAERRKIFLDWAKKEAGKEDKNQKPSDESHFDIWTELLLMEESRHTPSPAVIDNALDFINRRLDCSDFVINGLIRLWYKYAGSGRLTPEQERDIKDTFLSFNYWMDEPNPLKTDMIHYTENHQILFHTAEYLTGQLFPGETFTNNNRAGEWRLNHALPLIISWIEYHCRTGFAEWDSPNYYPLNLAALLNLVDFCADKELAGRAEKVVDLILFDISVDSFYGYYASTHGRAEANDIKSAAGDSMITAQALLWGLGRFQDSSNVAAVSFATSPNYRIPPVIEAIGKDVSREIINCERHSIKLTEEDAFFHNLKFNDYRDTPRWLAMGVFLRPQVIDAMVEMADKWDFWHYGSSQHGTLEPLKNIARLGSRLGLLKKWIDKLGVDLAGAELTEVNKMTYRTADYMLSCAQDYRKGEMGFQQHIWQATLSPYAVVFTTNPDSLTESSKERPNYWAGNGRLPRAAQHKNLLISLYNIDRNRGLLERRHHAFTHAYFPRFAFARIEEKPVFAGGGWLFAQKDNAYIALYSHLPYRWQDKGPDAQREIIALGRRNAWICLLGRKEIDNSFEEFMEGVINSSLLVNNLNVDFDVPHIGRLTFGWDEPLTVKGREVPLKYYPRWDNPYCTADFNSNRFEIRHNRKKLNIEV